MHVTNVLHGITLIIKDLIGKVRKIVNVPLRCSYQLFFFIDFTNEANKSLTYQCYVLCQKWSVCFTMRIVLFDFVRIMVCAGCSHTFVLSLETGVQVQSCFVYSHLRVKGLLAEFGLRLCRSKGHPTPPKSTDTSLISHFSRCDCCSIWHWTSVMTQTKRSKNPPINRTHKAHVLVT